MAEIIGAAYYRLLRGTGDTVLRQVCELMLRDETPHLRFHADRIVVTQLRWRALRRVLWTAQFRFRAEADGWLRRRQEGFLSRGERDPPTFPGTVGPWPPSQRA